MNAINSDGVPTAISLNMENVFSGTDTAGINASNVYPATAQRDSLLVNNWETAFELVTDPEWERIFEAIGEMNGKEHTLICLEGEMKMHLTIGGVPEVFVVYASGDEEIFFTAIDPAKAGDMWRWPSASS